jgi:tetratricopeptide (TPR) repeat protein
LSDLGIAFLHKAGILHKYINSANILLDKYCRAKITNFRKSRWSNGETHRSIDSFEEQIRWTAPERLGDDVATFTEECDIYSFGVVFYEIVSERFPWQGFPLDRVYNLRIVEKKELKLPPNIPAAISSVFTNCTCLVPKRRFKTTEIIDHLEAIRPECLENVLFAQGEDADGIDLGLEDILKDDENKYLAVRSTRNLEVPSDCSEEEENGPTRDEIIEKANNYHYLRDYKRARAEYEKVADDYPHALFRLGEYYYFGKGVEKDIPKSIEYLEKAVEGGDGDAMDMIGYLYLTGRGLSKDKIKAVKYFKQAVDLNIPHGMYHLGVCHFRGFGGLKKDVEESKRLMLKAANMGIDEAQKFAHQQEWDMSSAR